MIKLDGIWRATNDFAACLEKRRFYSKIHFTLSYGGCHCTFWQCKLLSCLCVGVLVRSSSLKFVPPPTHECYYLGKKLPNFLWIKMWKLVAEPDLQCFKYSICMFINQQKHKGQIWMLFLLLFLFLLLLLPQLLLFPVTLTEDFGHQITATGL